MGWKLLRRRARRPIEATDRNRSGVRALRYELLEPRRMLSADFRFAMGVGGGGIDQGHSIATDSDRSVYVAGFFTGTADFDAGPDIAAQTAVGGEDAFLAKWSSAGTLSWARRIGGPGSDRAYAVAVAADGSVYTTGSFRDTASFASAGDAILTSAGADDIFVSKVDQHGNLVWARALGGTGSDIGYGIAVGQDGSVYTTGSFRGTVDFDPGKAVSSLASAGTDDVFVVKLDANGNFAWAQAMGGSGKEVGNDIALGADGSVYTTGSFTGAADFDPSDDVFQVTSAGSNDAFVSKLAADGSFVWARTMGGTGGDSSTSIAVAADGSVYTTGWFQGAVDVGSGTSARRLISAGSDDAFVARFDAEGNVIWARGMGGPASDRGYGITLAAGRTLYVAGSFQGHVSVDAGGPILSSAGADDSFIAAFDFNGAFVAAHRIGERGNDMSKDVTVAEDGTLYMTGSLRQRSFAGTRLAGAGADDVLVFKLTAMGASGRTEAVHPSVDNGNTVWVHGSPGNDVFKVSRDRVQLELNQLSYTYAPAAMGALQLYGHEGDDTFGFNAAAGLAQPITAAFDGGDGANAATLVGSPDRETALLHPMSATLSGNGFLVIAEQVGSIEIRSGGGADRADLYGGVDNDLFRATPVQAEMLGRGFHNVVSGFRHVYAFATAGGEDHATLIDSPSNDHFIAYPTYAKLSGAGFYNEVIGFDSVRAISAARGRDRAEFYDSRAPDSFFAAADEAAMYGQGYYNHAWGFDGVYGHSTAAGARDHARLYGTDGDDAFVGRFGFGHLARQGVYVSVDGFDRVSATLDQSGDTVDTASLDYVFERLHSGAGFTYSYFNPDYGTVDITYAESPEPVALLHNVLPHDVVVASDLSRQIQRISKTGEVVWKINLPQVWPRSISLANGLLYYADGRNIRAADPATGVTYHSYSMPRPVNFVTVTGRTLVAGYDAAGLGTVEVFEISPSHQTISRLFTNPYAAGHPRHGIVHDGVLFVAATFGYTVYGVDMTTGRKRFELPVYYPNALEHVGGSTIMIVEEHADRIFSYDYVAQTKTRLLGSPLGLFTDLSHTPDYVARNHSSVALRWHPTKAPKVGSAVEFAGENTLYSPNFASKVGPNSYLVADTDNHRVALFVDGQLVSALVNLNNPAQALFVP